MMNLVSTLMDSLKDPVTEDAASDAAAQDGAPPPPPPPRISSNSNSRNKDDAEAAVVRFGPLRALVLCRGLGLLNKHVALVKKEALVRWRSATARSDDHRGPADEQPLTGSNTAPSPSYDRDELVISAESQNGDAQVDGINNGALSEDDVCGEETTREEQHNNKSPSLIVANQMLRALLLMIECRFNFQRHKKQSAVLTWYRNTRFEGEADLIGTSPTTMDLSTQNERLKEKIQSLLIQITSQNVLSHLSPTAKFVIGARYIKSWLRSKATSPQFKAFEKWKISTQLLALSSSMRAQSVRVAIGMQHVESEKEAIKLVRTENANLMNMLMCSLYFLKWKMRKTMMDLFEERKLRYEERRIVSQRMEAVRARLVEAQQLERRAVAAAAQRGADFCGKLKSVQDNLGAALLISPS